MSGLDYKLQLFAFLSEIQGAEGFSQVDRAILQILSEE